ncbi:MAG: signal peptidase II [Planctomycetia bacterium]|nr:signal peptidase II [Planctomycetia bacterium]
MKFNSLFYRLLLFFPILIGGAILDIWTKSLVFDRLGEPGQNDVLWLIPNILGIQTSLNQGALFGMGQGLTSVFAALSFIILVGILLWIIWDSQKSIFLSIILGLISAGIIGNLWDRLALHQMLWTDWDVYTGYCSNDMVGQPIYAVRDWILVMIGTYPWPNFNLADSYLVTGAILIGLYSILLPSDSKSQPDSLIDNSSNIKKSKSI